jgi:hypothetical protein
VVRASSSSADITTTVSLSNLYSAGGEVSAVRAWVVVRADISQRWAHRHPSIHPPVITDSIPADRGYTTCEAISSPTSTDLFSDNTTAHPPPGNLLNSATASPDVSVLERRSINTCTSSAARFQSRRPLGERTTS